MVSHMTKVRLLIDCPKFALLANVYEPIHLVRMSNLDVVNKSVAQDAAEWTNRAFVGTISGVTHFVSAKTIVVTSPVVAFTTSEMENYPTMNKIHFTRLRNGN